jgi:hypothetical protein
VNKYRQTPLLALWAILFQMPNDNEPTMAMAYKPFKESFFRAGHRAFPRRPAFSKLNPLIGFYTGEEHCTCVSQTNSNDGKQALVKQKQK